MRTEPLGSARDGQWRTQESTVSIHRGEAKIVRLVPIGNGGSPGDLSDHPPDMLRAIGC